MVIDPGLVIKPLWSPSWEQTDKSWIEIPNWGSQVPNWGSRDQRVCSGFAIITNWASQLLYWASQLLYWASQLLNWASQLSHTGPHQISAISQLQALLLNASGFVVLHFLYWGHQSDRHYIGFKPRAVMVKLRRINCCASALIVVDCWPIVVLGMFSDKLADDRTS